MYKLETEPCTLDLSIFIIMRFFQLKKISSNQQMLLQKEIYYQGPIEKNL